VVACLFFVNILMGNLALWVVNVPMYLALRRTSVVFMYAYEKIILKKKFSTPITVGLFLISLGAIVAGASDLTSDVLGFLFVAGNNTMSAFVF
jgi:uncharacterized membrane protein